MTVMLLYIFIK